MVELHFSFQKGQVKVRRDCGKVKTSVKIPYKYGSRKKIFVPVSSLSVGTGGGRSSIVRYPGKKGHIFSFRLIL